MSGGGVFGIYAPEPEAPVTASEGPDSGFLETIGAAFRLGVDEQVLVQDGRLAERYVGLVRDLQALGVPRDRLWKPQEIDISARMGNGPTPAGMEEIDRDAVWREIAAARARGHRGFASLPATRDEFDRAILTRNGERARDQGIVDRGGFLPNLIGSAGSSFTDPVNLLTLPIGGGGKTLLQIFAREALANSAVELLQTPMFMQGRANLGEDVTASDVARNVGAAALFGGTVGVGGRVLADAAMTATAPLARAWNERGSVDQQIARALSGAVVDENSWRGVRLSQDLFDGLSDMDLAEGVRVARDGVLTPTERAAVAVIERQAEIDTVNPYQGPNAADAHAERLGDAISRVLNDLPAIDYEAAARAGLPQVSGELATASPMPSAPGRAAAAGEVTSVGGDAWRVVKNRIGHFESGNGRAYNNGTGSNAAGIYQFMPDTWVGLYRRRFGNDGRTRAQILELRRSPQMQEQLMDDAGAGYMRNLASWGFPATPANLYLHHHFSPASARAILASPRGRTLESIFLEAEGGRMTRLIFDQNPHLRRTMTAGDILDEMARRTSARPGRAPRRPAAETAPPPSSNPVADTGVTTEALRAEATVLNQQAMMLPDMSTLTTARFRPDEVDVDAELMQFKGGGDAFGVTERLQGVETWNPVLAGRTIVWEAEDGRRLIADGHQRLGLARRIAAADPGQNPMIDAIVMREADGWDAQSVRTWAALKNIAEGSGTPVDAAKVFRAMGPDAAARYLPPRSALVRDAGGLARLGDEAFGAVVNELVDPAHAAIVGRAVNDPGTQAALVNLLIRLQPRTLGEADGIVQQGIAAGFTRETQADMFGTLDSTVSLMVERSRVLDRGLAELRKMRQIFTTAANNAETLGTAGNRIDVTRSAQEALDNATAVDIIARLAWRAGPVKDAIDRGARALADGQRQSDVVRQFVRDVRAIDVNELVRRGAEVEGPGVDAIDGVNADAIGRGSDVAGEDAGIPPQSGYSDQPDLNDNAWPSRAEIEAAGQTGFALFDEPTLRPFDDAAEGPGPRAQVDSIDHDLKALADELAQDGPDMFALDDGDPRPLADIFDEFDRDAAAIEAVRGCL
ncbi:hypothetical protein GV829_04665 [Sphingomonas lacunae]|uniref:Uncharacterized protein n=1 Tax=Sphingomonas lacunae TaxID=2698828 RepID=A0A6M4ARW9_9SPHN|nr:hypothetical protein [Sphingomonas lacunae]QJQ31828.1 hypothetical protein GV829_04665 [Sphingomonas lacunae]